MKWVRSRENSPKTDLASLVDQRFCTVYSRANPDLSSQVSMANLALFSSDWLGWVN